MRRMVPGAREKMRLRESPSQHERDPLLHRRTPQTFADASTDPAPNRGTLQRPVP